jgi:hypothetical protein
MVFYCSVFFRFVVVFQHFFSAMRDFLKKESSGIEVLLLSCRNSESIDNFCLDILLLLLTICGVSLCTNDDNVPCLCVLDGL